MRPSDFVSGKQGLDLSSAIEAMIKRNCIIDFGIVQNVVADGVVDVSVAVSKTAQDMVCMTCVLANIASSNFTLKVVPKKGDRVLVVYPRIFSDTMFNVEGDETKDVKIVVDKDAKGYNLASGIAVLLNQYKSNAHESVLTFDEDITFARGNTQLVLNKDDETTFTQNDVQITINKDSEISVTNGKASTNIDKDGALTFTNEKSSTSVDADGYLHYANTDSNDNKSKIDFTSSGFTIQDKSGNKIVSSSSDIVINGHLKVRK